MSLLNFLDVTIGFGGPPLLDHASLQIDRGERICLLGRNGAGKSTLMKLAAGMLDPDSGRVFRQEGAKVFLLRQAVPDNVQGPVAEIVRNQDGADLDWEREVRAEALLEQSGLDPETKFESLSAGWKRRVMLLQGLATDPDLLLLDEPTNHLDIESITWLESFLLDFKGALLFVTHDRTFLRRLATRILELDRGQLTSWSCDYDKFLERKEAVLDAEAKQQAAFDKKLAKEEAWLRQGIKARRTRNEGRVRALLAMRKERAERRVGPGAAQMSLQSAAISGRKVIEAEAISFAYPGQKEPVIRNFSTLIARGDKIGIVGPNGAGKSTLLRLLLGQEQPQSGSVRIGTNLEIAWFDQLRASLDEEKTVRENVAGDSETVTIDGRERHIISYLQDFLFPPDRALSPVKALSGGEKNRLLLARLFSRPANLLVLDEPTNDLDAETLELLESLLVEFSGTALIVSHDRTFLDNVVSSLIVFESDGRVIESVGGYEDYVRQRGRTAQTKATRTREAPEKVESKPHPRGRPERPRRMTNREKRELEELPARIEQLEEQQHALAENLADPDLYQNNGDALTKLQEELKQVETDLAAAFARWEELEELRSTLET